MFVPWSLVSVHYQTVPGKRTREISKIQQQQQQN